MLVPGGGLEKIVIITDRVQLHGNRANENVKEIQTNDELFVLYCFKR